MTMAQGTFSKVGSMQALTLGLAEEMFAIDADSVQEILDVIAITEVPTAPQFINGLINVRGRIVPLADLRVVFGMECKPPDKDTRIVVMEVTVDNHPVLAAILADRVHDVSDLAAAAIEEAPKVGMRWRPEYVRGIGKRGDAFIIIPDMGRIFEHNTAVDMGARGEERAFQ